MKRVVLEISVDRLNEKGVFIAEQILNVLHNTIEEKRVLHFWKKVSIRPSFSFEIANISGVIRFFFVVEEAYRDLLESQIYAHFPNVEIRERPDYLSETTVAYVGHLESVKDYFNPIRIYTSFKDRTEKEGVDPFSSLTSSLTSNGKDIRLVQIHFSPLLDREWKSEKVLQIVASRYPQFIKKILLSPYAWILKVLWFPFSMLIKGIMLIATNPAAPSKKGHDDDRPNKKAAETLERKFE